MTMIVLENYNVDSDNYSSAERTVLKILKVLKPRWKRRDIILIRTGHYGENAYYKGYTEDKKDAIVVKVFQNVEHKKIEAYNLEIMNYHGLCDPVLATFRNGFCTREIPGTPLNYRSAIDINTYPLVAEKIGEMHRILEYMCLAKKTSSKNSEDVFSTLRTLVPRIPSRLADPVNNEKMKNCLPDKMTIAREIRDLETRLKPDGKILFCHGHLRPENIFIDIENDEVNFAGLEFVGINYLELEIAQHFMTLAGSDLNCVGLDEYVPAKEFQIRWCSHYLASYKNIPLQQVSKEEVEKLTKNIQKFSLVFCLQEVIWSLTQLEYRRKDFDTLQYGIQRYQQYNRNKYNIMSLKI